MKRARGHWPCDSTYAPRGRTGVDCPHQYPSQVSAHHRQLESRGPPADAGAATPLNRSCYGLASIWIKEGHQALTPKCPDQQEKEDAAYPRLYHGWFCVSRKKFRFSSFPPHFFLTAPYLIVPGGTIEKLLENHCDIYSRARHGTGRSL